MVQLDVIRAAQQDEQVLKKALLVKKGDVFIDVGASFGSWSVWASQKVGMEGRVLALEPNPLAYAWLVRNTAREANVKALQVAAHSEKNTVEMWTVNNSMSSTLNSALIGEYLPYADRVHAMPVEAVRLDSLLPYIGDAREVVLKIDVEGGEMGVLLGSTGILHRVRMMVVEVHSAALRQEVERFLVDSGFSTRLVAVRGRYPAHLVGTSKGSMSLRNGLLV